MASGLKEYDVSLDNGATVHAVVPAPTTTLAVTGRTPGALHQVRVRARDNAGNTSAWSTAVPVTTTGAADTTPPTQPGTPVASELTQNSVRLTWTASTDNVGVTRYVVLVSPQDGGAGDDLEVDGSTLTAVISGLTPEKLYHLRVRAYDAAGNSALSGLRSLTTPAAPSGATPIASYDFDEATGTTASDSSGSRHLAVVAGNWATGHTGTGLSSAGGVVTVPSKAGLETAQRTLMFWAKYPDVGGSWRWPVEFFVSAADTCAWGIMPANGSGNLYARIRIGGVNTNIELASSAYTDWHHYAITYDGTTFRAYRDGVQVGSQAVSGTIDTADAVRIHAYGGANVIDDLRFYNTALTVTQIQDLMAVPV